MKKEGDFLPLSSFMVLTQTSSILKMEKKVTDQQFIQKKLTAMNFSRYHFSVVMFLFFYL